MDHSYSPNSTIEVVDDKLADQYFFSVNTPINHLPPPPPIPYSTASSNSIRQNSVNSYQVESDHPSVFSNPNAFNSVASLPDNSFYSSGFLYNSTDYELENPSIDSLPDYSGYAPPAGYSNFQMSTFDTSQVFPPYTPTISDSFTPTVSDSSFTPNSTFNNDDMRMLKKSPVFHSSTPVPPSSKLFKKASTSRMNSHLVVQTQMAHIPGPMSGPVSSLSSGSLDTGVSPLCHKYKQDFISTPISARPTTPFASADNLPPMTTFRHNSDSSNSSYLSESVTPRRSDSGVSKSRLNKKLSHRTLVDENDTKKPKKHTRRRLLPRSKNGCWICRIKHLKCNEVRPFCSSCLKFGIECDYSPEKPNYVTNKELRKEKLTEITEVRKATQRPRSKGKAKKD